MKRIENFDQVVEDLFSLTGGGAIIGAHWENIEYIILGAVIGTAIVIHKHTKLARERKANREQIPYDSGECQ